MEERRRGHHSAIFAICFPAVAAAGDYAPINCAKAKTPAETKICTTYSLGEAEARMATHKYND
jgi:uncharacterized protein